MLLVLQAFAIMHITQIMTLTYNRVQCVHIATAQPNSTSGGVQPHWCYRTPALLACIVYENRHTAIDEFDRHIDHAGVWCWSMVMFPYWRYVVVVHRVWVTVHLGEQ